MEKTLKLLSLLLVALTMTFSFSACGGDDDEPESPIDDWYSECISVSGGGLTPQQCSQFMNNINTSEDLEIGPNYVWRNTSKEQAIYYFDRQMRGLTSVFSEGVTGISGTLDLRFALKNSAGKQIKVSTIHVTSNSSSLD